MRELLTLTIAQILRLAVVLPDIAAQRALPASSYHSASDRPSHRSCSSHQFQIRCDMS